MTLATFPRCFVLHKSQTSNSRGRVGRGGIGGAEGAVARGAVGAVKGAQEAAAAEAAAVPDTAAPSLLASKAKT